ncbi:MAG: type III PLP-dependent enzyme [Sporomusaceae bacterium]|nr:type III PLP-dependent enzyme [Sporomusaceae bacterium]
MNNIFRLDKASATILAQKYGTPLLVLSLKQIETNYLFLREHLPAVKLHYAMKSNPQRQILRRLAELGACFDVASDGEMQQLTEMGIAPGRMVYANPVKTAGGLAKARELGVNTFTFDSETEIEKMAKAAPGSRVLLRIRVDNPDALVDLNQKFGAPAADAVALLLKARQQGLDAAGLCFHVGSQSRSAAPYLRAIAVCRSLFDEAKAAGLNLRLLDIGGGFPIQTMNDPIDISGMCRSIQAALAANFPDTEIWAEPGRSLCGTAVNLITRVIGAQVRNGQQWYFLDEGVYGSFSGVIFDHWDYELETFKSGEPIAATFAGPSCDSIDVMYRERLTPPLAVDDLLLVPACGAYTSASATVFNGFAKAQFVIWEEVADSIGEQLRNAC